MNRARQSLAALAAVVTLFTSFAFADEPAVQPNIVFAIADDWGWPHAGSLGDKVVKTPTFDRIASEGVLFEQAYVSSPSCTPSRNAILSGQYHWRLGTGASLYGRLPVGTPTYPLLLEKAGYHIGHWRKSYGPGDLNGWDAHPAGKRYGKGFASFLAAKPDGKPFCFWLGASDPHRGYKKDSGEKSGIDLDAIKLFAHFPDTRGVRGDVADYYFEVQRFDSDVAAAIKLLEENGELDNTIVVMTGDHGMPFPRCKSNNYDSGVRVPLAIRWGKNVTRPGRVINDFVSLTDLAPTFLELAAVEIPKDMTGKSLVPLLQTEQDGIVEPDERGFVLHGKERHVPGQEDDLSGYPVRAIRNHEFLYIRNFEPERWPSGTPNYQLSAFKNGWLADCDNGPTKTIIDEGRNSSDAGRRLWDLSFGKRPAEELFDCKKDPGQLTNVADDPSYATVKSRMAAELMKQLASTGDPRANGGGQQFDRYPYSGGSPLHPSVTGKNRKKNQGKKAATAK